MVEGHGGMVNRQHKGRGGWLRVRGWVFEGGAMWLRAVVVWLRAGAM